MGRRIVNLTEKQRQKMVRLVLVNHHPIVVVAQQFDVVPKTVRYWIKKFMEDKPFKDSPRSGRPRVLCDEEVFAIINDIKNDGFTTLKVLIDRYHLNIKSKQTLSNYLSKFKFHCYKAKRKPKLTAEHMARRVEWARMMLTWPVEKMNQIIFTDEKSFYNTRNSPVSVWREKGKESSTHYWLQDKTTKFRINCWGAITNGGGFKLKVVPNNQDSNDYFELIENILPDLLQQHPDKHWMQDGCSIHRTEFIWYLLFEHFPEYCLFYNWPAKSPDLNLIENIWGIMQVKLDFINLQIGEPNDVGELEERVHQTWNSISTQTFSNLYLSFKKRLEEVIENNGAPIDY
jgi:transposase